MNVCNDGSLPATHYNPLLEDTECSRAYTNSDTDFSLQIVCNLCIWKTSQESLIIQPRYKQKLHSDWFIEITGLFSSHLKLPIRPRAPFSAQWMNPEALLRIPVCVCTRTMHTINPMSWEMLPYFETPQSSGNLQHTLNDVPLQSGFEHMRNKTTIFHSCQACDAYEKILRFSKLRWYSHTIGSRLHFFFLAQERYTSKWLNIPELHFNHINALTNLTQDNNPPLQLVMMN